MANPMHDELALTCEQCWKRIYRSERSVELMDGERMHLKCAREYFDYRCTGCGCQWGQDVNDGLDEDERGCPECDGKLELMTPEQKKKLITGSRPEPA